MSGLLWGIVWSVWIEKFHKILVDSFSSTALGWWLCQRNLVLIMPRSNRRSVCMYLQTLSCRLNTPSVGGRCIQRWHGEFFFLHAPHPALVANLHASERITTKETLKQQLYTLNNRLTRDTREDNFNTNKFLTSPTNHQNSLTNFVVLRVEVSHPSTKENVEQFWKPLFETKKTFNQSADWHQPYKESLNIDEAIYNTITADEIEKAPTKFSNWKSLGIDKL